MTRSDVLNQFHDLAHACRDSQDIELNKAAIVLLALLGVLGEPHDPVDDLCLDLLATMAGVMCQQRGQEREP